jgi:hypothetical protein
MSRPPLHAPSATFQQQVAPIFVPAPFGGGFSQWRLRSPSESCGQDKAGTSVEIVSQTLLRRIVLFNETFIASVQIEEAKLSHANLPRSEHESLESDLRGGGKRLFFEVPEYLSMTISIHSHRLPWVSNHIYNKMSFFFA